MRRSAESLDLRVVEVAGPTILGRWSHDAKVAGTTIVGRCCPDMVAGPTLSRVAGKTIA